MTLAQWLATIALAQTVVCIWMFARIRDLSARVAAPPAAPIDVIRSLESRIGRLEARLALLDEPQTDPASRSKRQRRLDRRQQVSADGPVLITLPSLASVPVGTSSEVAAEFDRRFGPIWALADAGTPPDEIARQTGHPVGQVELILGLRRSRLTNAGDTSRSDDV